MQGTRRDPVFFPTAKCLGPGDYVLHSDLLSPGKALLLFRTPCGLVGGAAEPLDKITEHDDGTVSCEAITIHSPHRVWRGYLERGAFHECG